MTASRYLNRTVFINQTDEYRSYYEERNLKFLRHLSSPVYKTIEAEDLKNIATISHLWKVRDRYWKLGAKYYNDPKLWWLIAWWNGKPTEGHVKPGDFIYIPVPQEKALSLFNR